jgi:hypothetical protein
VDQDLEQLAASGPVVLASLRASYLEWRPQIIPDRPA